MPRIDNDIKLDFKDVLFRPKRSTIRSRADVSRRLIFIKYFSFSWNCDQKYSLVRVREGHNQWIIYRTVNQNKVHPFYDLFSCQNSLHTKRVKSSTSTFGIWK